MFNLNPSFKYVAEDEGGSQRFFSSRPTLTPHFWTPALGEDELLNPLLFKKLPLGSYWRTSLHRIVEGKLIPVETGTLSLAVDTPVWVRDRVNQGWRRRHFANFDERGRICCFPFGMTSFSVEDVGSTIYFEQYSLTDPEKQA